MTSSTTVVNVGKGEACDVYIGRAGHKDDGYFGNPFMILESGKDARFDCILKFREYFIERIKTDPAFAQNVEGLRGKRLGCFCSPAPCHGDIYVGYLEGLEPVYLEEAMARKAKPKIETATEPVPMCADCHQELLDGFINTPTDEKICDGCFKKREFVDEEDPPFDVIEVDPDDEEYAVVVGRLANDAYYTPEPFIKELLARVPDIGGIILEPCAGDGAISHLLELHTPPMPEAPEVWTNDIDDKLTGLDFTMDATKPELFELVNPDWVVTNPPYNKDLMPDIVKNALQSAYQGVAMLLRLSFLEPTIERDSWLVENPPDLLIVTPRFSFKRNGKTDSMTTAWFVWYNQPRPPYGDWRVQGNSPEWPRGIQIMPRSVLDGVK